MGNIIARYKAVQWAYYSAREGLKTYGFTRYESIGIEYAESRRARDLAIHAALDRLNSKG